MSWKGAPDSPQTWETFTLRLAQVIGWCLARPNSSDLSSVLRTPELQPRILESDRFAAIESVASARELYGGPEIRSGRIAERLDGGRLLVYFPDEDLACGAAQQVTRGFFDVNNTPPWDTWIAYIRDKETDETGYSSYLVSWIPPQFLDLVSKGIEVNPEQCIQWLSGAEVDFATVLRRKNTLES